jgi:hypothetical protein
VLATPLHADGEGTCAPPLPRQRFPLPTRKAALAEYAAERGIALAEVLAVGDFFNDVEMLREAGFGVAMGHAPDVVKAAANVVVPDNAQDGCAIALERYVLGA